MIFLGTNGIAAWTKRVPITVRFSLPLFTIGILLMLAETSALNASHAVRTVVLTGDSAPVTNETAVFENLFSRDVFGFPAMNSQGLTAFEADVAIEVVTPFGPRLEYLASIIRENDANGIALVAIEGNPVPGTGDTEMFRSFLRQPVLNDNNQLAFESTLDGIFLDSNGVLQPVVLPRSPIPITGKVLNGFSQKPTLNEQGQTAFRAGIFDPNASTSFESGIFISGPGIGDLMPIARDGDALPTPDSNAKLSLILEPSAGHPLNDNGQVAFAAFLTGSDVDSSNDNAILRTGSDGLTLVARKGNAAPVPGASLLFSNVAQIPAINNNEHVAFVAMLSGGGVDATNDDAIFSEGMGEGLALVAREGNSAPVSGAAVNYGRFLGGPLLNKQGELLFKSSLMGENVDDTNDEALFRQNSEGNIELVARRGDPAPVPESNVTFGRQSTSDFRNSSVNSLGQIAMFTALSDGTDAIFAEDTRGRLQVIARTGELLDVSDDPLTQDLREIRSLTFTGGSGNEDGRRSAFNDSGQITFGATFADNTQGIFVSNLVAVPGPGTIKLLVLASLALLDHRRYRGSMKLALVPHAAVRRW